MTVLNGFKIVTDAGLTQPEKRIVDRTWKERLFSWPWTPFIKQKVIIVHVPSKEVYSMNGTIIMHPSVFSDLKAIMIEPTDTKIGNKKDGK